MTQALWIGKMRPFEARVQQLACLVIDFGAVEVDKRVQVTAGTPAVTRQMIKHDINGKNILRTK